MCLFADWLLTPRLCESRSKPEVHYIARLRKDMRQYLLTSVEGATETASKCWRRAKALTEHPRNASQSKVNLC